MCPGDLRQLTNIEYSRIRIEKGKVGETKKKKTGEMRKVGKMRKRKGGGRGGKRMILKAKRKCDGEIQ